MVGKALPGTEGDDIRGAGGTDGMERRRSLDGTLPGIGAEKKSRTGVPSAVARVAIFADWME